jgi:hypothetical protein
MLDADDLRVPSVAMLAEDTAELLRQGLDQSERMRRRLAVTYGIDPSANSWPRFVNNHAWALVRLQAAGTIRKRAPGLYELAPGPHPVDASDKKLTPPILTNAPLPGWAREMVAGANRKNAKRWPERVPPVPRFNDDDLRALWRACSGRCMLAGLPFKEVQVGTGQARKPYAPSLDRIDPEQPYTRENCRLVLQAVNFALNAWGDEVFVEITKAAVEHRRAADQSRRTLLIPTCAGDSQPGPHGASRSTRQPASSRM